MKNIQDILKSIGVSIPEDKQESFNKELNENYKTISEVEKIEVARDNYKGQLDTAQTTLKGFEGVNVEELNGKIATLTNDLTNTEATYQAKILDMEFNGTLDTAISAAKAKNVKAIKALLDVDTLKQSKNQEADINNSIDALKKDNDYLFESDKQQPTITIPGQPAPQQTDAAGYMDSYYANNPFYQK